LAGLNLDGPDWAFYLIGLTLGGGGEFLTQSGAYSAGFICVGSLFRILLPIYFMQYFLRED